MLIESPKPVPPYFLVVDSSTCENGRRRNPQMLQKLRAAAKETETADERQREEKPVVAFSGGARRATRGYEPLKGGPLRIASEDPHHRVDDLAFGRERSDGGD